MSNPWFRMYSEFATDPKVQMLSEAMQRRLLMIMCMRCSNSLVTLQEQEIAFQLRITDAELEETKALFIAKKFIDKSWNLLNWEKRQFASDTSKARVAKHRLLQKEKQEPASNADVTLQKRNDNGLEQNRTEQIHITKAPPEGVAEQVWQDFQKLRKVKKAPVTQTVINGIEKEAKKAGLSLGDALEICCKRGWQGFEADWVTGKSASNANPFAGAI